MIKFSTIYRDYRNRLFYYLMRITGGDYDLSRDILQESFTRCLERYGSRIDSIALLYKIARNLVIDHTRNSDRNEPIDEQHPVDAVPVDHQILVREQYKKMLAALRSLNFDDREVLSLVASESVSYREIAAILGTTENNIKVRVHRARKRLRKAMTNGGAT
jgi:RNA polymerase sigma factor (sigma-70 family)